MHVSKEKDTNFEVKFFLELNAPESADRTLTATGEQGFTYRPVRPNRCRYRYTDPVWPETGRYRWNSNLNSNFAVQPVRTGIPAG